MRGAVSSSLQGILGLDKRQSSERRCLTGALFWDGNGMRVNTSCGSFQNALLSTTKHQKDVCARSFSPMESRQYIFQVTMERSHGTPEIGGQLAWVFIGDVTQPVRLGINKNMSHHGETFPVFLQRKFLINCAVSGVMRSTTNIILLALCPSISH